MYTLIFWILGCAGPECEIPAYEVLYVKSEEMCKIAEKAWEASNELHRGICLPGRVKAADG